MIKNIVLAGVVFIFLIGTESHAADNVALMQCLIRQDRIEIIGCLEREFPDFSSRSFVDPLCRAMGKDKECQKKGLEELLNAWQVLYLQCSGNIKAVDCIARIDISRCEDLDGVKNDSEFNGTDDKWIGAPESKGACYALGAFLKKDASICEKRFHVSVQVGCNSWLKNLEIDSDKK